jgi:ATP-dependent RNA helicase SUPV3L1/SUV3
MTQLFNQHPMGYRRVTVVLGPTNTGKTHLAIERMLGHASGMIGFPLRLLARENYDKICRLKGASQVALITGEEKIIPRAPRYYVCTVESMPVDTPVEFLAVDEIQLAADAERGHVFTDRLLRARGMAETMFLGSDVIRSLIRKMVPRAEFISRPRLSELTYVGPKKLTRLPPRSAIVAFSANEVYAIAELLRRQRGGTAVVLGALSPRTRNAQVELYQNGDVDYLVATDAIGMGLNMDVDHVTFARLTKFDGRQVRKLTAMEVGQIAGRAGRFRNDGTFGCGEDVGVLDPRLIERVQEHDYDPLTELIWRNNELDFRSIEQLLRSLGRRPRMAELVRRGDAEDHQALRALGRHEKVVEVTANTDDVRLLWDVCSIPDFRKDFSDHHVELLAKIYLHLIGGDGRLPESWVERMVGRLDRVDGDIDALVARIAHVRTWTYISHRGAWLTNVDKWQERTRGIEDRLSDALHERLAERFVDKRSALLVRGLESGASLSGYVSHDGTVFIEHTPVGVLDGFTFVPDDTARGEDERAVLSAAQRVLKDEIRRRVARLQTADDDAFTVAQNGALLWEGVHVGRLVAGREPLAPAVQPVDTRLFDSGQGDKIRQRLARFVDSWISAQLGMLERLKQAQASGDTFGGSARGLAFQLLERLGSMLRADVEATLAHMGREDRAALKDLGVRIGKIAVWHKDIVKPKARAARVLLWAIHARTTPPQSLPPDGRISVPIDPAQDLQTYVAIGFWPVGRLAIRIDMIERLAERLGRKTAGALFKTPAELAPVIAGNAADLEAVLRLLGYQPIEQAKGPRLWQSPPVKRIGKSRRKHNSGRTSERQSSATPLAATKEKIAADLTADADSAPVSAKKRDVTGNANPASANAHRQRQHGVLAVCPERPERPERPKPPQRSEHKIRQTAAPLPVQPLQRCRVPPAGEHPFSGLQILFADQKWARA